MPIVTQKPGGLNLLLTLPYRDVNLSDEGVYVWLDKPVDVVYRPPFLKLVATYNPTVDVKQSVPYNYGYYFMLAMDGLVTANNSGIYGANDNEAVVGIKGSNNGSLPPWYPCSAVQYTAPQPPDPFGTYTAYVTMDYSRASAGQGLVWINRRIADHSNQFSPYTSLQISDTPPPETPFWTAMRGTTEALRVI